MARRARAKTASRLLRSEIGCRIADVDARWRQDLGPHHHRHLLAAICIDERLRRYGTYRPSHFETSRIFAIRVSASVRTRNSTRRDRAGSSTPLASNTGCDEDSPLAVKYCLSQPRSPLTSGRPRAKTRADRIRACESSIFRKYASSGVVTPVQSDDVWPSMRTSLMDVRYFGEVRMRTYRGKKSRRIARNSGFRSLLPSAKSTSGSVNRIERSSLISCAFQFCKSPLNSKFRSSYRASLISLYAIATSLTRSASASTRIMYVTAIRRNMTIRPVIRSLSGIQ